VPKDGDVSSPLDESIATKLAKHVRLQDIRFLEIHAQHLTAATRAQLSFEAMFVEATWTIHGADVMVAFPFRIVIRTLDAEGTADLAELRALIRVQYVAENVDIEELRHFVGICGYMHAWPYLRSEIQSLTTKIGLPVLTLPLVVSGHASARVSLGEPEISGLDSEPAMPALAQAEPRPAAKAAKKRKSVKRA